ncbi:MAG TPA: hypothetical protein VKB46_06990 [Pyrinomonadaceae bacterium]|nr:hypothetical protein [Pyrinomonadaceae bacterium]
MRRRNTPNTVLRAVPHPVDPEADVLALYDARQKLQTAIATETQKGETAETDFVRNLAREISYGKVVNVESVFQRNEAAKTAADRAKDRIYALADVLAKINNRIEELKAECSDTVSKALSKRIEALETLLEDKSNVGKGFEEEIKALKAELNKLGPKTTDQAAPKPADPTAPKGTDQAAPKATDQAAPKPADAAAKTTAKKSAN